MSGFARRRGSHILRSGEHRAFGAPMNRNCTLWTLRVAWLKAFSLLRFFVAKDQEMTRRHAQWLTVIKRIADLSRPPTPKAATRHSPPTTNYPPTHQNPVHRRERKTLTLIEPYTRCPSCIRHTNASTGPSAARAEATPA